MEVDRLNFVKEKAPYSLRSAPESRTFPNAEIKVFEKFRGRGLLRSTLRKEIRSKRLPWNSQQMAAAFCTTSKQKRKTS